MFQLVFFDTVLHGFSLQLFCYVLFPFISPILAWIGQVFIHQGFLHPTFLSLRGTHLENTFSTQFTRNIFVLHLAHLLLRFIKSPPTILLIIILLWGMEALMSARKNVSNCSWLVFSIAIFGLQKHILNSHFTIKIQQLGKLWVILSGHSVSQDII